MPLDTFEVAASRAAQVVPLLMMFFVINVFVIISRWPGMSVDY